MRITHEPPDYDCPFCGLQRGVHNERNQPGDVVAVTQHAFARVAPKWWPDNPGALLVIPRRHIENIYDVPPEVGHAVWDLTARMCRAVREAYGCDGTSTRQHNEPHGNQDVWHLHVHVFARYEGDRLYEQHAAGRFVAPDERRVYADRVAAVVDLPRTFAHPAG
ncbi:HIT family protein [Luteipulveratus flavus]|uniref:HIT family protein n=1 Tax=Luteipulveratus flavus TaxID=3031728 RepID=A0ABT6C3Q5_9MICO|nr:HIT family protein [Luteipulveratus sp. YIM 133296]MDF8263579.1 HIT family protein [Luteipulveratus sp. YIM 133296]